VRPYYEVTLAESKPLMERYGLKRNSRNLEELIIRDFFQDKRGGVFLDVGANHYQLESNTFYLESVLGWSGVAVEPLEEFAADYATHRPRTKFIAAFAGDQDNGVVKFFVPPSNKLMASSTAAFAASRSQEVVETSMPTATLNTILQQAGVAALDFMSMDIELAEPQALAGFDLARFRPALVCIESHTDVRQKILEYFHQRGYTVVGKYLRTDTRNLYFKPL
jgi:FkbM family methyltransferase